MDFNDKDPIESLAAVLSVMLKIRNPELEDPEDLTTEMIEEGKSWALAVFQALLALDYRIYRVPQDLNSSERKTTMAELSEAEQADITCATDYLMRYEGRSKFMLDLLGKAQRIDGFTLSIRQAQVVLKIADEQFEREQGGGKAAPAPAPADDSDAPF